MPNVGKIQDGDDVYIIFDTGIAPLFVDLITEMSERDGIVRMSFAAITKDGEGQPKAEVTARLRMKRETAWQMCRDLGGLQKR